MNDLPTHDWTFNIHWKGFVTWKLVKVMAQRRAWSVLGSSRAL